MEALIPIILSLSLAAVLILRPLTKKLGLLLQALATERSAEVRGRTPRHGGLDDAQMERVVNTLDRLNARMDHIDDRIGFMERLIEHRPSSQQRLTG